MKENQSEYRHDSVSEPAAESAGRGGASLLPPNADRLSQKLESIQRVNDTGLPDRVKNNAEQASGMDLSRVKVHYNSSEPAQVSALAFTRGQEIHVAPGQERHVPHETWHVVQQMQGRVQANNTVAGQPLNDSPHLENEADQMGARIDR